MSTAIAHANPAVPAQRPERAAADHAVKLHRATQEFESLLVKQLLTAAKIGGDAKGGYGDMAIDAMANGIEKGGGLGLARRIEEALAHTIPSISGHEVTPQVVPAKPDPAKAFSEPAVLPDRGRR